MNGITALAKLKSLEVPVFKTIDAATLLRMKTDATNKMLHRLATQQLLIKVCRGLWAFPEAEPALIPEYLSMPQESYISLQSALYHHGILSQIPEVIYAVTIGRTKRVRTGLGVMSLHRIPPEFFGGFETVGDRNVKWATPEKALADLFYLSQGRSRLFASLPELDLSTRHFRFSKARSWARKIPSLRRRNRVERLLKELESRSLLSKRLQKMPVSVRNKFSRE